MAKFSKIAPDTFDKLQIGAGMLLRKFTPATGTVTETDIIAATSGGIKFSAVPTYSDFGEDIDNCPKNMMEFKRIDSWDVKASGSFVSIDTASAKTAFGAADVDKSDTTKVTPRSQLKAEDFEDLWLVCDYGTKGTGYVAIHMFNALSTGGFSMQTTDKAKGAFEFEFTGHYSLATQDKVPCEVYVSSTGAAAAAAAVKA